MTKIICSALRLSRCLLGLAVVLLVAGVFSTPARAAEDVVHFGQPINVRPNQQIHDAICFFCSVKVHGTANHDIVVFFGSVDLDGQAEHDVVDFFGDVRVTDGSSIRHDLVNFFGATWLGENASVGQNAVVMFGSLHEAGTASVGKDQVVKPGILFWGPFLLIVFAVAMVIRESRRARYMRLSRGC